MIFFTNFYYLWQHDFWLKFSFNFCHDVLIDWTLEQLSTSEVIVTSGDFSSAFLSTFTIIFFGVLFRTTSRKFCSCFLVFSWNQVFNAEDQAGYGRNWGIFIVFALVAVCYGMQAWIFFPFIYITERSWLSINVQRWIDKWSV